MSSSEVFNSLFFGTLVTSDPASEISKVDSDARNPSPWVNFGGSFDPGVAISRFDSTLDVDSSDRSAHSTIKVQVALRIEPPRAIVGSQDKAPMRFSVVTK
jgi:hypothetical protein